MSPNTWDGLLASLLGDGVDGVDDPRDVPEEGEQEADPELVPAAELEEDAEGREDDGEDDVDAVGRARHGRRCSGGRRAFHSIGGWRGSSRAEQSRGGWEGRGGETRIRRALVI